MLSALPLLTRLTATAAASTAANAARPGAAPVAVMVIGDSPVSQSEVDVLAPARQAGLERMTEALARFRPTLVAVEWPAAVAADRYGKYVAGTLATSRADAVQLGFRLAKQAEARIVGVSSPGELPSGEAVCEAIAKAGHPGDRVVVFHSASAQLRRSVAATPGLKLVEASAWLAV